MDIQLGGLNLNLLTSLDALLTLGSVGGAAKHIGVSQPAMSRNLASLRQVLGDAILVRNGNQMALTPRAEALAPMLRRALDELLHVLSRGEHLDVSTLSGTIRIGTGDHLAALLGPSILSLLASRAPMLTLRLQSLESRRLTGALLDGAVDLVLGPAGITDSQVESASAFSDPFACLVGTGHPSAPKRRIGLTRYLKLRHVLISPSGRGRSVVDAALESLGKQRHVAAQVESFLLAPLIVARTDLVLTAPRSVLSVAKELPVRIVNLPLELPELEIAMYWERRRAADPLVGVLRDVVGQAIAATNLQMRS